MVVPVDTLTKEFSTPFYVYDLDEVKAGYAALQEILPHGALVYYSLKANPHPDIAAKLGSLGVEAEISSPGELDSAIAAGFDLAQCVYTGPGKTGTEMRRALESGVGRISVESIDELDLLDSLADELGTTVSVLLRVNGAAAGRSGLRMTGASSQFGIDETYLRENAPRFLAPRNQIQVDGVHLYAMSNARSEQDLVDALRYNIELAASLNRDLGLPLRFVDLGGGFAAPYARPGGQVLYPNLRARVEEALDAHLDGWRSGVIQIAFESGRYLVGRSGSLVATVIDDKMSKGQRYIVLNTGINHLGGMSGLGRITLPSAQPLAQKGTLASEATIVGPLCTPSDVLGRRSEVPETCKRGDVLVFPNVGAYGLTASLIAFLGYPCPLELVLEGGELVSASSVALIRSAVSERKTDGSDTLGRRA